MPNRASLLTGRYPSVHGLRVLPSAANFIAVEMPLPAIDVLTVLREQKVACATWNHVDFPNFVRIGLGKRESSLAVVGVLKGICG